jgi:hypothetical protein
MFRPSSKDLSSPGKNTRNPWVPLMTFALPLAIALLNAVYAELERGYNALKGYDENKKTGIDDR